MSDHTPTPDDKQHSDGRSLTSEVSGAVSSARQGAEIGAKVGGGVGAAIGAGAGAAASMMQTKQGRRRLALGVVLWIAAPFIPLLLVAALLFTTLAAISGSQAAIASSDRERAALAAIGDGVSEDAVDTAVDAADDQAIPFVIPLAAADVAGGSLDAQPADLSPADQKKVKDGDTTVGPYGFLYPDAVSAAKGTRPSVGDLNDPAEATDWYVSYLSRLTARDDASTLSLASGAEEDDASSAVMTGDEAVETADSSQATLRIGSSPRQVKEAAATKKAWVTALGKMPVENAAENAEAIYDKALSWYFGNSAAACTTATSAVVGGAWTNPSKGPITSDFGMRVHPVTGVYKLHDGTDLADHADPTIYAAAGGSVTVENSSVYGPNWVKIDHGGGIVTSYGHMSSTSVQTGQVVAAGTPIGVEGALMPGYATGPHLHFSVWRNGEPIDPVPFMAEHGVTLGSGVVVAGGTTPDVTNGTAPPSQVAADEARLVQGNLDASLSNKAFGAAFDALVATGPDFVTLNDVGGRSSAQITAPGYASFRGAAEEPRAQSLGTAVAWRTDRWTAIDRGRVKVTSAPMTPKSSAADNRWAQWVTLQSADTTVSVIAAQTLRDPDDATRISRYRSGMQSLNGLVEQLSVRGGVLLGGDLSIDAPSSGSGPVYGPTAMLAQSQMTSTYAVLGSSAGGSPSDYVFFTGSALTASRQSTVTSAATHPALVADFKLVSDSSTGTVPVTVHSGPFVATSSDGQSLEMTEKQLGYASQVAATGAAMNVPDDGIVIAFMTVFVESKWKMYASTVYPETEAVDHDAVGSDHDSVGLFQQRPQSGWGEPLELMDATYSAKAFFGGPQGPNGGSPMGLLDHGGWQAMPKGEAAQDVQVSAFPDRYAVWEQASTELLARVKGLSVPTATCGTAITSGGTMVASFNTLGHSHTVSGGNKPGFPASPERTLKAWGYMDGLGVSLVGLQEFEGPQVQAVNEQFGATWQIFPNNSAADHVAWKTTDWELVSSSTFKIPYFHGNLKDMPLVELKKVSTGQTYYFLNVHNPATTKKWGNNAHWRAEALKIEKAKVKELQASGNPVILTGDFNDHDEPFCALSDVMSSPWGAGCGAPAGAPNIDFIFSSSVEWAVGKQDHTVRENKWSDHPLVYAVMADGDSSATTIPGATPSAAAAIAFAQEQLGEPYLYGATGPDRWDCSGLTGAAWRSGGIELPRTSIQQSKAGRPVSFADLQPGDLVFYYTPVSHVALYVGDGQIIHAPRTGSVVSYAPVKSMPISAIRRVTPETTA